jgi:hypothetical protein
VGKKNPYRWIRVPGILFLSYFFAAAAGAAAAAAAGAAPVAGVAAVASSCFS